jgi:hypothetical protein
MRGSNSTPYNPDRPTGGGNFNPGIKIDTSRASVAPPYVPRPGDFGWIPGGVGGSAGGDLGWGPGGGIQPILGAQSARSWYQQQALEKADALRRRRAEQREAVRQLDRQRDDRQRGVKNYVEDWDREFMSALQKGLRGTGITARWK